MAPKLKDTYIGVDNFVSKIGFLAPFARPYIDGMISHLAKNGYSIDSDRVLIMPTMDNITTNTEPRVFLYSPDIPEVCMLTHEGIRGFEFEQLEGNGEIDIEEIIRSLRFPGEIDTEYGLLLQSFVDSYKHTISSVEQEAEQIGASSGLDFSAVSIPPAEYLRQHECEALIIIIDRNQF